MSRPGWWLGAALALLLGGAPARGQEIGLRQPALSPDGAWLAFVWGGDLWLVESNGGEARRLYGTAADERRPIWSPDGAWIAFARQEADGYDLFVLPAGGGSARRLTWAAGDDLPTGFSPDGRDLLFQSRRGDGRSRIYSLPVSGGEPRRRTEGEAFDGVLSPDGRTLAFTAGTLPWWRTSSRGPTARSLRIAPLAGGEVAPVVAGEAQQLWPQWLPDGQRLLYVSSASLTGNLWVTDLERGEAERLTGHTEESVRFPSLAADGSRVAYEMAGDLYIRKMRGQDRDPVRLPIRLPDGREQPVPDTLSLAAGVERAIVDASGRWLLVESGGVLFRGELAAPSSEGAVRCEALTTADGRASGASGVTAEGSVLYVHDDAGRSTIRRLSLTAPVAGAPVELREPVGEARIPTPSPDGSLLAYVRRGERDVLVLGDGAGGRELDLLSAERIERVAFRPTEGAIACVGQEGSSRAVWLLSLQGEAPRPLGVEPALDSPLLWSSDGSELLWISGAGSSRELRGVRLGTNSASERSEPESLDWPRPPGELRDVAFDPATDGDLLLLTRRGARSELWRLAAGRAGLERWGQVDSNLVEICAVTNSGMVICRSDDGRLFKFDEKDRSGARLRLEGGLIRDRRDLYRQAYEEATRALAQSFYDPAMHLKPWSSIVARYRPRVAACRTGAELRDLLLMAAGELEASHVNLLLPASWPHAEDGDLGLDLCDDEAGAAGGLLVVRVLPGGPSASMTPALRAGDRILTIDGVAVGGEVAAESLLEGRAGAELALEVAGTGGRRTVRLRAIGASERQSLENQLVDHERERRVAAAGDGRLAYLHLRTCDEGATQRLAEAVRPREGSVRAGLILDLRENPGGAGMDPFLRALSLRPWAEVRPRGGAGRLFPAGSWRGEIVAIIDESTASAAELIALGLRELGLGTLVGRPTAGAALAAREVSLADGSRFQMAAAGWYRLDGAGLENRGVAPDVTIESGDGAGRPDGDTGAAAGAAIGAVNGASEDRLLEAAIRTARLGGRKR